MDTQEPAVGQIVHYVSHGTPVRGDGSQAYTSQCRAAIITEVDPEGPEHIGLVAVNPTGLFFHPLAAGGCDYDAGGETIGNLECPDRAAHGSPFRYCHCGWVEARYSGGTWHWPERV